MQGMFAIFGYLGKLNNSSTSFETTVSIWVLKEMCHLKTMIVMKVKDKEHSLVGHMLVDHGK